MAREFPSVVCFGEILWDVFPSGKKAGGAPMNVAVNLHKLGVNVSLISKVGKDNWGAGLMKFLESNGLEKYFIQEDKVNSTGLVRVYIDEKKNAKYDIVFPSAWDFIECSPDIEKVVEASDYMVFGSLACRNGDSRQTLLRLLEKSKRSVFDVNLRSPHYTRELVEQLLQKADIVKVNEEEIVILGEWMGYHDSTIEMISKKIIHDYQIDHVIVTLGENGTMVSCGDKLFRHPGFKVDAEDTVGSGDAFLAAFLANRIKGQNIDESLAFACATGSYVVTQNGANPPYDEEKINEFIKEQTYAKMNTKQIL